MKKICFLVLILFCLAACGGGGDSESSDSRTRELALDETASDKIDEVGEVHMYHFHADTDDSGRILRVNLSGTHPYSPVDFMLTIYRKDENGDLSTIFGESAGEEVRAEADINIDIPIVGATDLYMAVRDFKDDEASDLVSYRLTATYAGEIQPNDSPEQAIELQVGADNCYAEESIFPESDEDYYRFTISGDNPAGVYRVTVQYNLSGSTPMPVNLDLELYNGQGRLVQQFKGSKPADNVYVLLPYLEGGVYSLVVADQGRDDESQHHYSICIEPISASEVQENDTSDETTHIESGPLTGSLEYIQDEDWYEFEIAEAEGDAFQIIRIDLSSNFGGPVPDALRGQAEPAKYRISVLNGNQEPIHIYDQSVLVSEPQSVVVEGNAGTNYIMVKPVYSDQMLMALPYQLTLEQTSISDPGEADDPANILESGNEETVTGKIYKVGDQDTYIADERNADPKILEVDLTTNGAPSQVSYAVKIQYDGQTRLLRDTNGTSVEDGGTHCKTSIYLPPAPAGAEERQVRLTVIDDQNNDGDDVVYNMTVRLMDIPGSLPSNSPGGVSTPQYFNEIDERVANDTNSNEVTVIEYNNDIQPQFKANTDRLRAGSSGWTTSSENEYTSPWIAGYVDYDGDRDLFELNLDDITQGVETWYCDIKIQMVAQGGPVEYSWTLFRDSAPANDVLVERTYLENVGTEFEFEHFPDGGGIVASWADTEITPDEINMTIPDDLPDDEKRDINDPLYNIEKKFWIGKDSRGSKFYLSINDFNRAILDAENRAPNQTPDNDWGYASTVGPYYFQVTVTYHGDRGCPPPYECD
jgi:hypothetical protein